MDILMRHDWPGNVRELENVIERAVILGRGDRITPSEFPEALRDGEESRIRSDGVKVRPGRSLKEVEKDMILRTLDETGGNRTRAAQILGISRRTLQLKLKEYGIQWPLSLYAQSQTTTLPKTHVFSMNVAYLRI